MPYLKKQNMHEQKPIDEWIADKVLKICTEYYGVNMYKKTRVRHIVEPRQVAYYFLKKYTRMSLSSIGKIFNQDHATALHAVKKISGLVLYDKKIRDEVSELNPLIKDRIKPQTYEVITADIHSHLRMVRILLKRRDKLNPKLNVVHNN